ncbi:glutathione S-transferase 1-like [Uloborus diversus]|uniref:glutathione S-transferase 1-like n=1 Tax=Uloborus diversus TaxID=327109 RepID=UPI00240A3C19|nr:glutathione S-transferase 1-like [Uloborus diversus]XP_054712244.1 glutathione S-transferase 1-like [Uloborus diversus]
MTIDVYQLPVSGPCRAVLSTANYLGITVNKIQPDFLAGAVMKPEFLKMNPQHTVPTIDDDGFYLAESRAIQAYLVNKYSPNHPIYPEDSQKRATIDRMLHFDIGTLYRAELDYLIPQVYTGAAPDPEKLQKFKDALSIFEELLSRTAYAAGDHITLADISMISNLTSTEVIDFDFSEFPKVSSWMQKMKGELPDYHETHDVPIQELKERLKAKDLNVEEMLKRVKGEKKD